MLTPQQAEQFFSDGFLLLEAVFNEEEVALMLAAFDRAHALAESLIPSVEPGHKSLEHHGAHITYDSDGEGRLSAIRHISMVGNIEPDLLRLGGDPRLRRIAAPLLGCERMKQLINQAHFKRPGSGVAFGWHQDSRHRGIGSGRFEDVNGRGSYVQMAIALDDVTAESGPLSFVRGSQRLGHIDDGSIGAEFVDAAEIVTPLPKRGDVALFGPYTIHGSQANRSDHWRRVFINGFAHPAAPRGSFALPNCARELTA